MRQRNDKNTFYLIPGCERRARWQLANLRASSPIWTSEASRARTRELAGEAARGRGKESDHCKLSFPFPAPRFGVSSRVPLARLLFTISHKWRACSQASNLLVASCTLCSCKKTNVFWPYKEKERVKQKSNAISRRLKRKSVVSVMRLVMHM